MQFPRMRRVGVAGVAAALLVIAACSGAGDAAISGKSGGNDAAQAADGGKKKELPMGGTKLFPDYRIVGFAGSEGTGPVLGKLGVGNMDDRMKEVVDIAKSYQKNVKKVLPVGEFIATIVHGKPGEDGMYRGRASEQQVQKHLDAVRKVNGILLLAIQPGRSDFVTETKYYEKFLKEPDVGVALDPEWRMGPGEIPMKTFGHVSGQELDDTAAYLEKLVKDNNLPEKVMLYHQLRADIVRETGPMKPRDGVVQMVSVDGIGSPDMKIATWNSIMRMKPKHVYPGFKLFYQEDATFGPIMKPEAVLGLTPSPFYVLYE
ncbi:Uncharacterised protein [Dermatophilus congolensis]|uniref:Lipoprotein n=1 Tax=Dermatophilus congolensis TaxID=1863 RepID=A0AA46H145_9MICO|nr:hypothetical protein [Dermatophilus congolensis]STD12931.1 Uncharacterised protein [Dermatophilus congolensis]